MSGSNSTSTPSSLAAAASTSTPEPTPSSSSSSIADSSSPTSVSTSDSSTLPPSSSTTLPISSSSSSEISSSSDSSTTPPPSSSSSISSTPTSNLPSSTTTIPPTSSTTTPSVSSILETITQSPTSPGGATVTATRTSYATPTISSSSSSSSTSSSSSASGTAGLQTGQKSTSHGLGTGGTIAVAVVVPIVAVALLVLAGLFLWRKRKARKDAEELRRKEVEEYGYNPNNDPTLPAVGSTGGPDGPFEMREDGSSGYRGWGTTAVASSGRKASTTLSGGQSAGGIGMAYSEGTSPTHGPISDTRSDNPLVDGRPISGEQEPLGAMGPSASSNRGGDINRGPSNASSSYSAANRSDGSGELNVPGGAYYNNQYDTGNPYSETTFGSPPGRAEMSAQPVIRDVQARRNTRIENPSHFPQQSSGISQNF